MHRFIVKPADIKNDSVLLNADESHHAIKVLRLQVGDAVQILDGKGSAYSGFIASIAGGRVEVSLAAGAKKPIVSSSRITLACSMIKADRMEWLIEKACELGVSEIIPLATERSLVRLDEQERVAKQKRWQKIVEASCKQCGLSVIPTVHLPQKWKDFISTAGSSGLKLIASLEADAAPLKKALENIAPPDTLLVAVGPEGDFTPAELESARKAGFRPVGLGELVLRSETAAIYALSALQYHFRY